MLGLIYLEGHPGNAPGLHDLGKDADIYVYDLLVLQNLEDLPGVEPGSLGIESHAVNSVTRPIGTATTFNSDTQLITLL